MVPEINPRSINYKFKKDHIRCSTEVPINLGLVYSPIRDDFRRRLEEIQDYPFHLEVKIIWYKPKKQEVVKEDENR